VRAAAGRPRPGLAGQPRAAPGRPGQELVVLLRSTRSPWARMRLFAAQHCPSACWWNASQDHAAAPGGGAGPCAPRPSTSRTACARASRWPAATPVG
jgi:hypothetical protein